MDRHLTILQFTDLFELCEAYKPLRGSPNYNLVLTMLKEQGFSIKSISDKKDIKEKLDRIIDSDKSALDALNEAFKFNLLKKSEQHSGYLDRRNSFLTDLSANVDYENFKKLYFNGKNTLHKIKGDLSDLDQYDFEELERDVKKEIFYKGLFSDGLKFQEIINYFHYKNEDTEYITMHKTKGSGIDNVLVVLDEYFWSSYNFKSVFADKEENLESQKLLYVACSRAKSNLKCVRLVSSEDEKNDLKLFFENAIEVLSGE